MRIRRSRTTRLAAMAAATTVSLSALTACGGSSGSDDKTLEMWTFKQSHAAGLKAAAKDFEKETGIKVDVEVYTPDDAFVTKIQSSAKTGDLPDVMETHSDGEDLAFGVSGIARQLKDVADDEWLARFPEGGVRESGFVTPDKLKENEAKTAKAYGVKLGDRYSIPFTVGTFGIVYANKQKLADAGITEPPATWDEFTADLEKTTGQDAKEGGLGLGLKIPDTGLTWVAQPLAYSMLGRDGYEALFSRDTSANWASPNGTKVLEKYDELTPYWTPGSQSLTIDEADQAFAQGKSAFLVGGTFTLSFLEQNGMDPDDVLAFGLPPVQDGQVTDLKLGPLALTNLVLSATSDQPDDAEKWARYLSEKDVAAKFAEASSDLPAAELGDGADDAVGPALAAMLETFEGTEEQTYDPQRKGYFPPGYEQDKEATILTKLSPLKELSPEQAGKDMADLNESYWEANS